MKDFLLEIFICYFCGDELHNFELVILYDGRNVEACDGCHKTILKIQEDSRK